MVLVHAAFVAVESVATCFIARSFFDNVIGLDLLVQARTAQLDQRNADMRLVMDHVQQGFLTIDRDMVMSSERSRMVGEWLGPSQETRFADYLARRAPQVASAFSLAWEEVVADIMPLELTTAQLPSAFTLGASHFQLEYEPIVHDGQLHKMLIVISEVTAEFERERLEVEQRDVMRIVGRVSTDKAGVLEFFHEASGQASFLLEAQGDAATQKRVLHTLKGNAMIFGVQFVARLCEQQETRINELGVLPSTDERVELSEQWTRLCKSLETLLGDRKRQGIEIDDAEYETILTAVLSGAPSNEIALRIQSWRLEPTLQRLVRIGEQARALAQRTGKGTVAIDIADDNLRLDSGQWAPFWSAFVHVVRNAVDHGLETESERAAAASRARRCI